MRSIYIWFAGLLLTALGAASAYLWLDRPIALIVHSDLLAPQRSVFIRLSQIPDPIIPIALLALIGLGFRSLAGRPLSNHYAVVFVCSWSLLFAEAIKNRLKFFFGRTWPETWTHNNPSFIRDGVYGFHFMHSGDAYQSFPSGHITAICAVVAVLWISYPRWRALYVTAVLAVGLGLVGANYHFLSDVIAGAFVGVSTGVMATAIWRIRV